jgi:hypothetical protein
VWSADEVLLSVELSLPITAGAASWRVDGRLVAFAGVVPVPARAGWLLEDLVRDPRATEPASCWSTPSCAAAGADPAG